MAHAECLFRHLISSLLLKFKMVKLELAHKEVILIMLDYLREHNLISSMLQLEQEADVSLYKYS